MDTEKKVQFVALTKEEIDAMIQQAALAGAQVASDAMMVGQRKSEKEKIDRRLHNTDLLLRNYRTLKASYENAVYKSKEGEVTEVLEDIMTMKDDKVIVESIKTSAKRTAIMVQHIDKMLDVYRIYCSKLSEKDKRRYKIIKAANDNCRNFKKILGQQGHCLRRYQNCERTLIFAVFRN